MSDWCELNEFQAETFPLARKTHGCCECGDKILPGQKHCYFKAKSAGEFWTVRQCMDCRDFCMEIRDHLMEKGSCLIFGELTEYLSDFGAQYDTVPRKAKHLRSMLGHFVWERERGSKPFFKKAEFPHREPEL